MARLAFLRRVCAAGLCLWPVSLTVATDYTSSDTPVSINDNSSATSTINVPDAGCVSSITVRIDATHTWVGDVTFALTHVDTGTTRDVVMRIGFNGAGVGDSSDYGGVYSFNDLFSSGPSNSDIWIEAAARTPTQAVTTGDYKPRTFNGGASDLAAFVGESMSGDWQLTVSDSAVQDTGMLNSWTLSILTKPLAGNVTTSTPSSSSLDIPLNAVGCGTLSYIIASLPAHGTLKDPNGGNITTVPYTLLGNQNVVRYTVGAYQGPDSFTYRANNGQNSDPATVSIEVGRMVYASTDTPMGIPENDPSGITSTLHVSDVDCVGDLNVTLNITHTYIGDLIVQLTSPDGVTVRLHNRTGGTAENIYATYDDGVRNPDGPGLLADFSGGRTDGDWLLFVSDNANIDTGSLDSWELSILPSGCVPQAFNVAAAVPANSASPIALNAVSHLGNPLIYIIVSLPPHGSLRDPNGANPITTVPYTLAASGTVVNYTPNAGYAGPDSFTYKANDGQDSNVATVSIRAGFGVVIDEPLDSDPGWTVEGGWAFGAPAGLGSHNFDPTSGYTGSNVYGYNLSGDYPNGLTSTEYLTTTAINLAGVTATELHFARWLGVELNAYDHATVEVSNNNSNWTVLFANGAVSISDAAWMPQIFDISAVADNQATVYVRWGLGTTDGSVTYPGWNVDDIRILGFLTGGGCLPCDTTCDGSINQFDIVPFVNVLTAGGGGCSPCAADANNDGSINQFDIVPFVHCLGG